MNAKDIIGGLAAVVIGGFAAVNIHAVNPHMERANVAEIELAHAIQERDNIAVELAECSGKSLKEVAVEHGVREIVGRVLGK